MSTTTRDDRQDELRLQLEIQADVARAVTAEASDLEELLRPAAKAIAAKLSAAAVGIWTPAEEGDTFRLEAAFKADPGPAPRSSAAIGEAYARALSTAARPSVFLDPPFEQPLFAAGLDGARHHTAVCPLIVEGTRLVGILGVARAGPLRVFEERAFASVADQVALAIEKGRALQRLREREDGLDILIGTAPDGIVVMDEQSRIIATNPSLDRIFGYEPGELVGQTVTVLMPERFRPRHTAGVRHYEETGKKRISWNGIELVGLHKDGSEFPIEISFGEYAHEGARVFTGFIRDITDRKATEERERRRRRVIQTAAVYLGSSLVALQVADLLLPVLPLPDWTFRGLVLIGFLFFPVALALAWTFELSADGLRRMSPSGDSRRGASRWRIPGRLAWIGAAGLLGGLTLAPLLLQSASGPPRRADYGISVAVLPFEDVSEAEPRMALGFTDEVLARLAADPSIRVTSRTSVLAVTGGPKPVAQVARELGVSYILEGSVRRAGGRTRVTAQLILAASDAHVWSEVYERSAPDPLAAEEAIARGVARGVADALRDATTRPDPPMAEADSGGAAMTVEQGP